jgi:predicted nucleic acid-binding protein
MRIFLDANILFSAAKSDGAVRQLLSILGKAGHELRSDGYVIEEARRNLSLKSPHSLAMLEALLETVTLVPIASPGASNAKLRLPEKDRPVLEAAIRSKCDILVTGDKSHFGRLYGSVVEGVEILAPAALAEKLVLT